MNLKHFFDPRLDSIEELLLLFISHAAKLFTLVVKQTQQSQSSTSYTKLHPTIAFPYFIEQTTPKNYTSIFYVSESSEVDGSSMYTIQRDGTEVACSWRGKGRVF